MSEDHDEGPRDIDTQVESPPSGEAARPKQGADRIIGTIVGGRYKVERKLGEGGMGAVYLAHHEAIGKKVAIKCLTSEMAAHKQVVERFKREARAATAAGNEHIIDVTDMGELPDGSPFIVLELLEGEELTELIERDAPLPVGRCVKILLQVCDALQAAHDAGIVHRDLKPDNIYLLSNRSTPDFVKVLDFGISKFSEKGALGGEKKLTATGMTMGTPHYMSPEQAQGFSTLDHRTDIYAMGVILFEMLTGDLPFDAETYPLLVVEIACNPAPNVCLRRPDVPSDVDRVIQKCLAKDMEDRYPSAQALAEALAKFEKITTKPELAGAKPGKVDRDSATAVAKPTPSQPRKAESPPTLSEAPPAVEKRSLTQGTVEVPVNKSSRAGLVGGALALLVAAGGAAWALSSGEPETQEVVDAGPETEPDSGAEPPEADAGATAESETPSAHEVRVRIVVAPADAKIYLDDVEFPSPLNALRPRSLDPVRLRIERRGYQTHEELLVLDRDLELIRTLEAGRSGSGMRRDPGETTMADPAMETVTPMMMDTTMDTSMMDGFRDDF